MNDYRMRSPTTAIGDHAIQPGSEVVDVDGGVVGRVTVVDDDSFVVRRSGILGGTMRIRREHVLASDEGHIELRVSARELSEA